MSFVCSFVFALSLLLCSCTASRDENTFSSYTLRGTVKGFEEECVWKFSDDEGDEESVLDKITSVSFAAVKGEEEDIYPSFIGSFSLDVTAMQQGAFDTLDSFFSSLSHQSGFEDFVDTENLYSLIFLLHDLDERQIRISRYVLGEPFAAKDFYQCPVRIYYLNDEQSDGKSKGKDKDKSQKRKDEFCDIYAFVKKSQGEWKIVQLEFFDSNA